MSDPLVPDLTRHFTGEPPPEPSDELEDADRDQDPSVEQDEAAGSAADDADSHRDGPLP